MVCPGGAGKSQDGLREHTRQGFNTGRPPYGYLPARIPHPNPAKHAEGKTKTRLEFDPDRAPVVAEIFRLRVAQHLGSTAIASRLNQDPVRYPPPGRGAWNADAVARILANPKYTGYMVWGRHRDMHAGQRRGMSRRNPPQEWVWSPEATHPAIITRTLWQDAQAISARRRGSRNGAGANTHPQTKRTYLLRSVVVCALCGRRMRGKTTGRSTVYYGCELKAHHGVVDADRWPDHPSTIYVREDALLDGILDFFATRLLGPQRRALLAADLAASDQDSTREWEQQQVALHRAIDDLDARTTSLLRTLERDDDPTGELYAQIKQRTAQLHQQQQAKHAELQAHVAARPAASTQAPELLDQLPNLTSALDSAPAPLLRALFEAFRLQVRYGCRTNHATCHITLGEDTLPHTHAAITALPSGNHTTTTTNQEVQQQTPTHATFVTGVIVTSTRAVL